MKPKIGHLYRTKRDVVFCNGIMFGNKLFTLLEWQPSDEALFRYPPDRAHKCTIIGQDGVLTRSMPERGFVMWFEEVSL